MADYTEYVGKEPTDMQSRMIEWLQGEEVGADASACKNKQEAFELGARLGIALRIQFQKSDFNQDARSEAATAREDAKAAKKAAGKKGKKAAEPTEPEEAEEEAEEAEEVPKPAKRGAKKGAKKATAKKSAKKSAPAADEDDEDDDF